MYSMMNESEFLELRRLRQLEFFSDHLTVVEANGMNRLEKKITDWLWANTRGRFWIGERYVNNNWQFIVGFEVPYEATYFSLKFFAEYKSL